MKLVKFSETTRLERLCDLMYDQRQQLIWFLGLLRQMWSFFLIKAILLLMQQTIITFAPIYAHWLMLYSCAINKKKSCSTMDQTVINASIFGFVCIICAELKDLSGGWIDEEKPSIRCRMNHAVHYITGVFTRGESILQIAAWRGAGLLMKLECRPAVASLPFRAAVSSMRWIKCSLCCSFTWCVLFWFPE